MPGFIDTDDTKMFSEEELDDLLYCSRAGELEDLKQLVEAHLSRQGLEAGAEVDTAAVAFNELMRNIAKSNEPHNTLLHFASANGHLGE